MHMGRTILHSDANTFYASVEMVDNPEIRDFPLAVCGDPEARHGIVLTANRLAKSRGVKTGMAIWQARQVCHDLLLTEPHYRRYIRFSKKMRKIYEQYSDRVESFGLDECWLDVSNPGVTIEDGERIAHEIRNRVRNELGITVSVGVADNKIFAKLGSDMKKPDAVTVIHPDTFQQKIWSLPVSDLLYVGPRTAKKLRDINIGTIGALATAPSDVLRYKLGKNGLMLQAFANGLDESPVMPVDVSMAIKSVGNSTTTPHDIVSLEDARCVYYLLCESVGARLREHGFRSSCVSISIRTTELAWYSCQRKLNRPTNITSEIAQIACELFAERFQRYLPLRSVGVSCGSLVSDKMPIQLDMLGDQEQREKAELVDAAVDSLRNRYGNQIIQRGVVLTDSAFASINPKDDHTIHPVPFFAG